MKVDARLRQIVHLLPNILMAAHLRLQFSSRPLRARRARGRIRGTVMEPAERRSPPQVSIINERRIPREKRNRSWREYIFLEFCGTTR